VNTAADARRRVLYQAMQVYLAQVADPAQGIPAPPAGPRVVHPESLLTYSGMTPVEPLRRWLAATSFITGELCYVPAEAVHLSGRGNVGGCFEVTSAGRGTGLDHDGAVVAGLGSALAYYALRRTLAGHPACPLELPPAVAADSPAGFLVRAAGHFGLEPRLYLLPGVPGFPVVVAVSEARAPGAQDHLLWSAGWGADALLDALRDLVGQRQLLETGAAADLGDALLTEFHPGSLRVEAGTQPVRFEASRYAATRETLGDSLVAAGLDALVAEVTTADLRGTGVVHAVRVLLAEASWSG
jgi:ribosomal protein S12 methylthiotransferase accessory factor YcaO